MEHEETYPVSDQRSISPGQVVEISRAKSPERRESRLKPEDANAQLVLLFLIRLPKTHKSWSFSISSIILSTFANGTSEPSTNLLEVG